MSNVIPNEATLEANISKRVRRVEIFFFVVTLSFITFISNVISSILEMQQTISSLRGTQATLKYQIELTNEKLNEKEQDKLNHAIVTSKDSRISEKVNNRELQKQEKQIVKPLSSIYSESMVSFTDLPRNYSFKYEGDTIKNVKSMSLPKHEKGSRIMQFQENVTESVTSCNETLFRLELQLDDHGEHTSFHLISSETGNITTTKMFTENDSFSDTSFEMCLQDGHYQLMLLDEWGDGIKCINSFDGSPCYNIYINDVLAIPGKPFHTALNSHEFDTRSLCLVGNRFVYELNLDIEKIQAEGISVAHRIINSQTQEEEHLLPVPNHDENKSKMSSFRCLDSFMYDFELSFVPDGQIVCDGPCYTVSVNDETIIEGENFFRSAKHRFFIAIDGIGRKQTCSSNPLLAPITALSQFSFDERVSKILNIIQAVSNIQDIFTRNTSQNQAACFILYDDPLQIKPEDPVLLQRYALAVFLYSTNELAEVQLPLDMCLSSIVKCNAHNEITTLAWSKYVITNVTIVREFHDFSRKIDAKSKVIVYLFVIVNFEPKF